MDEGAALERALEHHRAGRLDEAALLYRRILKKRPNHFDILHLLAQVALQGGDAAEAAAFAGRAAAAAPHRSEPHALRGQAFLRLGRPDEAAANFREAVGRDSASAAAHNGLGTALRRLGKLAEAAASYERAVALEPAFGAAWYNLGQAHRATGDLARAEAALRRAAELEANSADARGALAEVLSARGRPAEAVPAFRAALALAPGNAAFHCGLGDALHALGDLAAAIEAYRQSVHLDPAVARAWWGLGCAQSTGKHFAAAADSLARAAALTPGAGEVHHNLGKALFELGQTGPALASLRRAAALLDAPGETLGMIAVAVPGGPDDTSLSIRESRRAWAAVCAPTVPRDDASTQRSAEGRRLRVGYVSSFFQHRNWMKPVWGVVNRHDRERFEVHLFSDAPLSQIQFGYCRDPRDHFHDITGLSNGAVAQRIAAEGIDVLVDLNGYSKLPRLPLFALRPAPVAVAWFGLYGTSGMSCFDAAVVDAHVVPPGEEASCTEPVVRIDGCYLPFEANYPTPEVTPAPCRQRCYLTFGCLAPQYKITTEVVESWARILHGAPTSRLIVKNVLLGTPDCREFMRGLFERFGIGMDRVELDGPAEHFTYLQKYADVDLSLDTFPYNGGTSTAESLWQGVPVLSFYGDRWAARISASLMRHAGLPEFVAPDREGYVACAIEWANSPERFDRLDDLRRGLRDRLPHTAACDVAGLARALEREYFRLWRDEPTA